MSQRELNLKDLDAVIAEARQLNERGYTKGGNWDLSQVCLHVSASMNQSIDGFMFSVPLPMRVLGRLFIKRQVLATRKVRPGAKIPEDQVPGPSDEDASVAILATTVDRLQHHKGEWRNHPIFGPLSREEWMEMHTIHSAHHLSFLIPKTPLPLGEGGPARRAG